MENDQVFAAEAEIDSRLREDPSSRPNGGRHHTAIAEPPDSGRPASRRKVDDEDTPLLSRTDDDLTIAEDDSQDDGPSWSGERDFEGKTWWNKPSVRIGFLHAVTVGALLSPMVYTIGLLAATTVLPFHPRIRRHSRPQAQPHPHSPMPGIPLR